MASRTFKTFVEQELGKFPHFLIYAVLEWVLIILLFIDGFLAFVAIEFAKFFELRIPCLLCSRIDHMLVHRNSDSYYNDSICESHKKNVSYLAYCHVHRKLSDIRKMCEGCLLSFATEKESDCDTYKSLVGILHKDIECFVEDDHKFNFKLPSGRKDDAVQIEKSSVYRCSCCGDPLKVKSSYSKGIVRSSSTNAPAPSPRSPFVTLKNEESRNLELPHIRYTELRFMSDTESEIPEDEGGSNALIPENQCGEDAKAATVPLLTESEDMNEDSLKTPISARANKFFGIPLTDSATASPRWPTRFPRKLLFEKPELVLPSEASDGESILHRLKRQVRLDRKSLIALYMELDEERSASAVAANNAMAMITRLQAEKAAVQMEALQYQRMMEEQAEYDQEALQAMNDLLAKRDEEIKVLEECEGQDDDDCQVKKSQSSSPFSEKSEGGSPLFSLNLHNSNQASSLDFGGDTSHLLDRLKYLEKKFHSSESTSDMVDHFEEHGGVGSKAILAKEVSQISERLKALEEDKGFLNHAAQTLEEGSEGTAVLTEIAQHLQKLQHFLTMPLEDTEAI